MNRQVYPRIAVIIPIYNAQQYLQDCLDSLLCQTYQHWAAYCVDDGSTDNSGAILDEYAKRDSRILAFHKDNGGAASARNFAIRHLENEEWLSFVDADDYIAPTMYEKIIYAISTHSDVDYVRLFCQTTNMRYHQYLSNSAVGGGNVGEVDSEIMTPEQYFLRGNVGGSGANIFVKQRVLKNNNIFFCDEMRMLEDQVVSMVCASVSKNVLILFSPKNYYAFSNPNSVTHSSKDSSDDIIRCVNKVFLCFQKLKNSTIMEDYFYKQYLPSKYDALLGQRIRNRKNKTTQIFIDSIDFSKLKLSARTRIKQMIVRVLNAF